MIQYIYETCEDYAERLYRYRLKSKRLHGPPKTSKPAGKKSSSHNPVEHFVKTLAKTRYEYYF